MISVIFWLHFHHLATQKIKIQCDSYKEFLWNKATKLWDFEEKISEITSVRQWVLPAGFTSSFYHTKQKIKRKLFLSWTKLTIGWTIVTVSLVFSNLARQHVKLEDVALSIGVCVWSFSQGRSKRQIARRAKHQSSIKVLD
jgi:hypothetical protein